MHSHSRLLILALCCALSPWVLAQEDYGSHQPARPPSPRTQAASQALQTFRTIFVRSETVYMKSELLQNELRLQPEFSLWGLKLVLDAGSADTVLEIHRPFLTFDWDYKLLDARTQAELASGTVVASEGHRAAERIAADLMKQIAPLRATDKRSPQEVIRSFRTLYVESHTIYMKSELIHAALSAQPALALWGVELVPDRNADIVITIHRPFMSFDWEFKVRHPASGQDLGGGSIVAWDGPTAAPLLASMIVARLGSVRSVAPVRGPQVPEATASQEKQWRVRLQSGYGLRPGAPLTVVALADKLVLKEEEQPVLSIPARDVLALTHSTAAGMPALSWWTFRDSAIAEDQGGASALVVEPVLVTQPGRPEPVPGTDHYVTFAWREAGRLRQVEVAAREGTCKDMLKDLQVTTHRSSLNLPEEAQRLRAALARDLPNAVPVEFDRAIRIGWQAVPAGQYRMVILPGEGGRADLYLFSEPADLNRIVAQAVVERTERPARSRTVQVTYKEENGIASLSEIRSGPDTLRFTAVPLAAEE